MQTIMINYECGFDTYWWAQNPFRVVDDEDDDIEEFKDHNDLLTKKDKEENK